MKIVYDVNTQSVKAAQQSVTAAKLATDQLTASAKKLGDQGKASTQQFSSTIAGLTLQMQQLKARIDLTNQSDTARLNMLISQYRQVQAQLNTYNAKLADSAKVTQGMASNLNGLFNLVRTGAIAVLAKETVTLGIEMARLGGQVEGVKKAFDKLPNSALLLAQLRESTHGMVDELTLMQKALQAQNFGIPVQKLGMLLEFATARAQQTGISVQYLVDSIVTGLGRNSIKILDNLQINIGELKKRVQETGQTTQEVAIQMIGESLKKMDSYVVTSETKVVRLETAWTNFKQTVSQSFAGGTFVDALTDIFNLFGGDSSTAQAMKGATQRVNDFRTANEELLKTEKGVIAVERELDKLKVDKINATIKEAEAAEKLRDVGGVGFSELQQLKATKQAATERNQQLAYEIQLYEGLAKTLRLGVTEEVDEVGVLKSLNEKLEAVNESITNSGDVSGEFQKQKIAERTELERLISVYSMSDDELTKYIESLDKGTVSTKEFRKAVHDELEELNKKLSTDLHGNVKKGEPVTREEVGLPDGSTTNSVKSQLNTIYDYYMSFWDKLALGFETQGQKRKMGIEQEKQMYRELAKAVIDTTTGIFADQLSSINELTIAPFDARIKASEDYYKKQIDLAGDNKRAVKQLEERAEKENTKLQREKEVAEQRAARRQILINTAQTVMRALSENIFPVPALAYAALAAGMGASQLAIVNRAPRGYATGVIGLQGPGTGTSDDIPIRASRGESIMTAEATSASPLLLSMIQSRRIDDRMISALIAKNGGSQMGFSDKGIIAAIKSKPEQDIVRKGSMIYEAKREAEGRIKYVRSKYLG